MIPVERFVSWIDAGRRREVAPAALEDNEGNLATPVQRTRELSHYRDNTGLEVDTIIRRRNGEWIAAEIKLGAGPRSKPPRPRSPSSETTGSTQPRWAHPADWW